MVEVDTFILISPSSFEMRLTKHAPKAIQFSIIPHWKEIFSIDEFNSQTNPENDMWHLNYSDHALNFV